MSEKALLAAGYLRLAPMAVGSDWSFRVTGRPWRVDSRHRRHYRDASFLLFVLDLGGWSYVRPVTGLEPSDLLEVREVANAAAE